jgi:hypothetical protein
MVEAHFFALGLPARRRVQRGVDLTGPREPIRLV